MVSLASGKLQQVAEMPPSKCQSHGPPFMERGRRKSKLRDRLTMHDAAAVRCVSSCGMNRNSDPARRRRKSSEEATRKASDEKE